MPKPHVSSFVFDSSALLAAINLEPGGIFALALISRQTLISAVNAAEVYAKLLSYGDETAATGMELLRGVTIVPFTEEHALRTAELIRLTRHAGLSLGDRACLALAIGVGAEVYTADRVWATLDLECQVHVIR